MPEITEPLTDEELRETAENGWAPHGARLVAEHLALRTRAAELEAFVADLACHGLRVDTDPTRPIRSPEQRKADLESYLRHADRALREDARRFVPDADRPRSAGRPRPAPRVEVVAECVTELDPLRAQGGDR